MNRLPLTEEIEARRKKGIPYSVQTHLRWIFGASSSREAALELAAAEAAGSLTRLPFFCPEELTVSNSDFVGEATPAFAGALEELSGWFSLVEPVTEYGKVGDLPIVQATNRMTAEATAEGATPTDQTPTYSRSVLAPKTISTRLQYDTLLEFQANAVVSGFLLREAVRAVIRALEAQDMAGSGAGNNQQGLWTAAASANPSQAATFGDADPTWDDVVGVETAAKNAGVNRQGNLAYILSTDLNQKLKTEFRRGNRGDRAILDGGMVNGYRAVEVAAFGSSRGLFTNFDDYVNVFWGSGIDVDVMSHTTQAAREADVICYHNSASLHPGTVRGFQPGA